MVTRIFSSAIIGLSAKLIEIELVVVNGLPQFSIVGLPSTEVKEAKERVYAAIKSSGFKFPQTKKIVNLAPANIPKSSTCYDLGIAYGLLLANGEAEVSNLDSTLILGELSLDGTVRPISGVLLTVLMAREQGMKRIIVPIENLLEASLVEGIEVCGVESLKNLVEGVFEKQSHSLRPACLTRSSGVPAVAARTAKIEMANESAPEIDFADIQGQACAKRALEIAAAGGHNVAFTGPPGSGKTLLAKAFSGILPPLTFEEALEVTKIYSISNLIDNDAPLNRVRPFRSVHHSASRVSIIGGGSAATPGEISLAHKGVLFFDELPEFPRATLESLRQPLEDKTITITRLSTRFTYPADFIFLASFNPCPCGFHGDSKKDCICSGREVQRYKKKISGPLLDRIDLFVEVPRVSTDHLMNKTAYESSSAIRKRIIRARETQRKRLAIQPHQDLSSNSNYSQATRVTTNSQMSSTQVRTYCLLSGSQKEILKKSIEKYALSARAYYRILKIARTIADLARSDVIQNEHLLEALQFRNKH